MGITDGSISIIYKDGSNTYSRILKPEIAKRVRVTFRNEYSGGGGGEAAARNINLFWFGGDWKRCVAG